MMDEEMPRVVKAQISAESLNCLPNEARQDRFAALAVELYHDDWRVGLTRDMRKTRRTIDRWRSGSTPIPVVVLVALGAMVAAKRAGI
jgi:hypothetical protein